MKILLLAIIMLLVQIDAFSGNDDTKNNGVVFGRIYTGFYYNLHDIGTQKTGFDFTTGILGYRHQLSENVNAILIYDVTRTTNIYSYSDFSGDSLSLDYFEGSKYTAFLKMAQINWKIIPSLELSVGQLLNQQYLTLQDKWWGLRYVRVTFQEAFRYGMPADFGARLTYSPISNLNISIGAVNGEGPFRYQDDNSNFLYSTNIEYGTSSGILFKIYADVEKPSIIENGEQTKSVISGFLGFKKDKLMTGLELNYSDNYRFQNDVNHTGLSLYSSFKLQNALMVFGRLDYGNLISTKNGYYGILGVQYQPDKNYSISINYRHIEYASGIGLASSLNINFGIKF